MPLVGWALALAVALVPFPLPRFDSRLKAKTVACGPLIILGVAPGKRLRRLSGTITSPFGWRRSLFGNPSPEFHNAIDISAPIGTPVAAALAGTVALAGWHDFGGNCIHIDHGDGLSTGYAHLSQIFVADGQRVQQGQTIGAVGMTGAATGPHLDFSVSINAEPVDPNDAGPPSTPEAWLARNNRMKGDRPSAAARAAADNLARAWAEKKAPVLPQTAFDVLAERVGPEKLNAYAVAHGIAKDDPRWARPLQMLDGNPALLAEIRGKIKC